MEIARASFKASAEFLEGREDVTDEIRQKWRLLLTKKEIKACVKYCARVITEKCRGKNIVIVCILKGAMYFLVDLTRKITIPHSIYCIESSSYHEEQSQGKVEILSLIKKDKFKDKDVVVVIDELLDNGNTMESVVEHIITEGNVPPEKIFQCALLRKDNNSQYKNLDFYGLLVSNCWLVGMGLDSQQHLRNWTCLYACPKNSGIPKSEADKIFEDDIEYGKEREKLLRRLSNL